jgi:hypothetical protein
MAPGVNQSARARRGCSLTTQSSTRIGEHVYFAESEDDSDLALGLHGARAQRLPEAALVSEQAARRSIVALFQD